MTKTLREIAEEDIARISKTVQLDSNGTEYHYDETRKCFVGEKDGKQWLKGVETDVPAYWWYCPHKTGDSPKGYEVFCRTPHFVLIYQDGEDITCTHCGTTSKIKLILPKKEV